MIPSYFVTVDKMPLAANGKVDRSALPEPQGLSGQSDSYRAPSTEFEKALCGIWEEVLGVRPVGLDDNFFDLGGHSLKGMMLTAEIQSKLGKSTVKNVVRLSDSRLARPQYRSRWTGRTKRDSACRKTRLVSRFIRSATDVCPPSY